MTRFMMSLEDAVDLVLYAFKNGKAGEIFVQKSPATNIITLVRALKKLFNAPHHPTNNIGTRHGEKLFEVLLSREEMARTKESRDHYCILPDIRDLNYEKFIDKGEKKISNESPLGKALLGKAAGREIEITAPAGKISYKIITID